jgi:hypothetical protein
MFCASFEDSLEREVQLKAFSCASHISLNEWKWEGKYGSRLLMLIAMTKNTIKEKAQQISWM